MTIRRSTSDTIINYSNYAYERNGFAPLITYIDNLSLQLCELNYQSSYIISQTDRIFKELVALKAGLDRQIELLVRLKTPPPDMIFDFDEYEAIVAKVFNIQKQIINFSFVDPCLPLHKFLNLHLLLMRMEYLEPHLSVSIG